MKSLVLATVIIAAAIGTTQMEASSLWSISDARPEAVVTGAALLMLAGVVRDLTHWRASK